MSVLINMEMPTSCADCRLMADGWCYSVGLEQREKISTVKRPTWCPLIPVPPHGRLIDGDKLNDYLKTAAIMADGEAKDAYIDARAEAQTMPTIIPAEEGET